MIKNSSVKLVFASSLISSLLILTACNSKDNVASDNSLESNAEQVTKLSADKVGLNGEFDENGLAKRVAVALETIPQLSQIAKVHVAQAGDTVILKGNVGDQNILDQIISVAKNVPGVGSINAEELTLR